MKSDEFLNEVLLSAEGPPDFVEQFNYFHSYQDMVLDTLKEFHRVCEKNSINYHVTYGSLLGLIRDGGQIPWDYDIDTFIPSSQKDKLIEALRNDLSDRYYAVCSVMDDDCRHFIIRICPKGYNSAAVHVDVFYYCGAPENATLRKLFDRELRLCAQIRFSKKVNIKEESLGKRKRIKKLTAAKVAFSIINEKLVDKKYERLIHRYPIEQSKYVVSADFFADWYLFPQKLLTETILFKSDIGEFRIPADYETFLKMVYGDYMSYPPLVSRIGSVLNANKRFQYFESIEKTRESETYINE